MMSGKEQAVVTAKGAGKSGFLPPMTKTSQDRQTSPTPIQGGNKTKYSVNDTIHFRTEQLFPDTMSGGIEKKSHFIFINCILKGGRNEVIKPQKSSIRNPQMETLVNIVRKKNNSCK